MKLPNQTRPAAATGATLSPAGLLPAMAGAPYGVRPDPPPEAEALIYAVGALAFDFRTQVWRDYFAQQVGPGEALSRATLVAHLREHLTEAPALTWTLSVEQTPIYAIRPEGPFTRETYAWLIRFLSTAPAEDVDVQVSIPGVVTGVTTLSSGAAVPVLRPVLGGLFCWSEMKFIEDQPVLILGATATGDPPVSDFAGRIWRELRNRGALPHERAFNYVATRAYQEARAILRDGDLEIDTLVARPSPVSRPDADCWDVQLVLFSPAAGLNQAKIVYRYTVDVSKVLPVLVVPVSRWLTSAFSR